MTQSTADSVAKIILDLPTMPTTADVIRALTKAEHAGFHRALNEIDNYLDHRNVPRPEFLRRQAD